MINRALKSRRPDRLFDDPLAAAFAGREGFAWLDGMELSRLWGGPGLYIVIRTRFFDDFLLSSCQSIGARQIVLLAAGMDARANQAQLRASLPSDRDKVDCGLSAVTVGYSNDYRS